MSGDALWDLSVPRHCVLRQAGSLPSASQQVIGQQLSPGWRVDKGSSAGRLLVSCQPDAPASQATYSLATWQSSSKPRDSAAISTGKQEGQI